MVWGSNYAEESTFARVEPVIATCATRATWPGGAGKHEIVNCHHACHSQASLIDLALEDALTDLESSSTKTKSEMEAWKKKCTGLEEELTVMRKERSGATQTFRPAPGPEAYVQPTPLHCAGPWFPDARLPPPSVLPGHAKMP